MVHCLLQYNYYSLFCGVQELILAATAVTDPDTRVCPEPADGINIAPLQLGDMHRVYVLQPLSKYLKNERETKHVTRVCDGSSDYLWNLTTFSSLKDSVCARCVHVIFIDYDKMSTCVDVYHCDSLFFDAGKVNVPTTSVFVNDSSCGTGCEPVCFCWWGAAWRMLAVRVYLVLRVGVGDSERCHGSGHGLDGRQDVLEDTFGESSPLLL